MKYVGRSRDKGLANISCKETQDYQLFFRSSRSCCETLQVRHSLVLIEMVMKQFAWDETYTYVHRCVNIKKYNCNIKKMACSMTKVW